MPKPATKDIDDCYRGDDWSLRLNFWDNSVEPAEPLVLTGRTYVAMVRETPDSPDSTSIAIDQAHLADGYITLSLSAAQTQDLPEENEWDLEETVISTGKKQTILRGKFLVGRDVTR